MSVAVGRLHIITDTVLQTSWSHVELARMAVIGGADVVQFRQKDKGSAADLQDIALKMRQSLPPTVQLVINDHVDVAKTVGNAGVHLGAADTSPRQAREVLGPDVCIGATANSLTEAQRLFDQPVDYLGIGPVFGTTSKANPAPPLGLARFQEIAAAAPFPVIAIGGIQPQHVASLLECGAHGVAILSGAVCQVDVIAAVRSYTTSLEQTLPAEAP